jgi:hypothetical protein
VPANLKGEVVMTARAELDGLGPADGPVLTWTVPDNFAQALPAVGLPFGFAPNPVSSGTNTPGWATWLGLVCLLAVIVLLLNRTRSKRPLG